MEKQETRVVRVRFGTWAWDKLPGGDVQVQLDVFKPQTATVAEGVEALVREQIEGGAGREIRIEPTSWNEASYNGFVTVADPNGGYERTHYFAEMLPRPAEPRHAEDE